MRVCTVTDRQRLPETRVLAATFARHHPGERLAVLVTDGRFGGVRDDEPFEVVDPSLLELPPLLFRAYAVGYDPLGFAAALRPWLLRRLLAAGEDAAVFLDPHTEVLGRLTDLGRLAARHGVVLVARRAGPLTAGADAPDDEALLRSSALDPALVAVGRGGKLLLDWWCERLPRSVPPEQWVAIAPALFPVHVWRDAPLSRFNPEPADPSRPPVLARFDRFDPSRPWLADPDADEPVTLLSRHPRLAALFRARAVALPAAAADGVAALPYDWHRYPDGEALDGFTRAVYARALVATRNEGAPRPPDHWDAPQTFRRWLAAPAPGAPPTVSRYLWEVYQARLDLRETFPGLAHDPEVASRFLAWAHHFATAELGAPAHQVPALPAGVGRIDVPAAPVAPERVAPGVTVAGYLRAELGLGEAARLVVRAARDAGEAVATRTYEHTASPQGVAWDDVEPPAGTAYDVNVVVVNGAETPRFAKWAGPGFFVGRTTVGLWFWEAERLTPEMAAGFAHVDEVWVTSEYTAAAVRAAAPEGMAVHVLPLGVSLGAPSVQAARLERLAFGFPDGFAEAFLFGFAFDYASTVERKNPAGVVEAYRRAFPEPDVREWPGAPRLVLKSVNADAFAEPAERLRWLVGGRPDITLIDETWPADRQHRFLELLDAYVSLHRAEGYGLGPLEALALGKAVIATDYSGTREFLHAANSWPVPYTLTEIPPGTGQYPAGARWAEPDLDAAAAAMRRVLAERDVSSVRGRGERGRAEAAPLVDGTAAAAFLRDRLASLRAR